MWAPGELVMGITSVDIPAGVEAGELEVRLSILEADNDKVVSTGWWIFGKDYLPLGTIDVSPWPMETELPAVDNLVAAEFGDPELISLHGYDLLTEMITPNESIDLSLVWRSFTDAVPVNYSVFLHLADDNENIIAQRDGIPAGGSRPTTSWRQDEIIVDPHVLTIPADAESGEYNLWIGFYDPITGQRLPVSLEGNQQADNRLLLQIITVAE